MINGGWGSKTGIKNCI